MARYVDGFVIPISKRNLPAYRRMAQLAGKVWREYGALDYKECIGEDFSTEHGAGFRRTFRLKPSETIMFSYIVYKSRAHRDRVNAKVMKDPRIAGMMDMKDMPFDVKRMLYGGFEVIVEA